MRSPLVFLILPVTVAFAIFPGILVLQLGFWAWRRQGIRIQFYLSLKLATIVLPSFVVTVTTMQVPGFFGVAQFWTNCPAVESYLRLVPPVVVISISSVRAAAPGQVTV